MATYRHPATMVVSVGGEHCRRDRELENQPAPSAAARTLLHAHYCRDMPTKQVALTTALLAIIQFDRINTAPVQT